MHNILNLHTNMHAFISKLLNVLIKMCYFWLIECKNSNDVQCMLVNKSLKNTKVIMQKVFI